MKIKEDEHTGYLILDGDIIEQSKESFKDLRYVEAFALLILTLIL